MIDLATLIMTITLTENMTALTKVQKLEAELEAARAEEAKQACSKDDFEGLVVKFNELGASINAMLLSRNLIIFDRQ